MSDKSFKINPILQGYITDSTSVELEKISSKNDSLDAVNQEALRSNNYYEKLGDDELAKIHSSLETIQADYSTKKGSLSENIQAIKTRKDKIASLSSSLIADQEEWNTREKEYIDNASSSDIIPNFLRTIFNYYPEGHDLYSPGVEVLKGLNGFSAIGIERDKTPSPLRSLMNESREEIRTKDKEIGYLSKVGEYKNRQISEVKKSINRLAKKHERATGEYPNNLLEEFIVE